MLWRCSTVHTHITCMGSREYKIVWYTFYSNRIRKIKKWLPIYWGKLQKTGPVSRTSSGCKRTLKYEKKEILLFCLRMRSDEINRCLDGVNLLCFIVRDLKGKFFKRHHDLDCVQAIESKVLLEMGSRCHLRFDGETRNWLLMTAQCYEFIITEHSLPLEVQYLILDLVCNTN